MANYNRPTVSQSKIIDLKGRKVGTEDLVTAALLLEYVECAGFRGIDVNTAECIAKGLRLAVERSECGDHEGAGKAAGNCAHVLKNNLKVAQEKNKFALGSMSVECRDGQVRKLGAMVEWFSGVHSRIHEQIEQEKANEHVELSKEEAEALELERFQIESGRKEIAVETRAA